MDYRFFEQMLIENKTQPGRALFDSKVDYINDFSPVYGPEYDCASRKNFFDDNLLGDPELNIWISEPGYFNIIYPSTINESIPQLINVSARNASNGSVANATV